MKTDVQSLIPQYNYSQRKRSFDLVVGSCLLLISFPTLLFFSFVQLLSSGWPIFYSQKRLGRNKKIFTLYKFRTMRIGADLEQKALQKQNIAPLPMFKIVNDPRFTRLGYFLSRTGLDELPQLINVLKNDMSLVGPRPLPVKEGNALSVDWHWRWQVKPGLFSYWVLSDKRYKSLEKWKHLEKQTVQISTTTESLRVIIQILKQQTRALFHYLPNIFQ